jgi:cardiolipin synthase
MSRSQDGTTFCAGPGSRSAGDLFSSIEYMGMEPDETAPRRWRHLAGRVGKWTGITAVLLLALVGFLHLTRGTAVTHVIGVDGPGASVAPSDPGFPVSIAMLTGASIAPGHRVEVTLDGDGTYERLWQDLRSATTTITLQLYYGAPGRMASTLGQILEERAAAGVAIYLLYDAFGTGGIPDAHLATLRKAGVRVEPFRPLRLSRLHLAQNRSHVRGIVVDGLIGWTGGFGIDDKWFGDGRTNGSWRETNVRFEGPAVRQLQAAFAAAWAEATGVLFTRNAGFDLYDDGTVTAGTLYASPNIGTTQAERFYALSMAGARKTLYLTNAYFAPDRNFVEQLINAARRGVDVRVLTAGPLTDVKIVRHAGRAWYDTLLSSGVRIYEWQPTVLHSKTFVVDGLWSTIGTINLDNRSMSLNEESTLMVLDPAIGAQMDAILLDDLRHSEEITLEKFRQRSWLERIAEQLSSLATPVL